MTLDQLPNGSQGIIKHFNPQLMGDEVRLISLGIQENKCLKVIRRAPMGDPIQIKIGNALLSIRKSEARHISIDKL